MENSTGKLLHELDINSLERPFGAEKLSAAKSTLAEIVARVDGMELGESCTVSSGWSVDRFLVLEVDWYQFRSRIEQLERSLLVVSKTLNGTAELICRIQPPFPGNWSWMRVKLNRIVSTSELKFPSPHWLSADSRSVVFRRISLSSLSSELSHDSNMLEFKWQDLQPFVRLPTAQIDQPNPMPRISPAASPPVTQELLLTKAEITYLIGPAGARIEATRQDSQATIKVLPIPKKLTASEQNHPRSQAQTLAVTGNAHQVATALAHLESQLVLHRLAPSQHL